MEAHLGGGYPWGTVFPASAPVPGSLLYYTRFAYAAIRQRFVDSSLVDLSLDDSVFVGFEDVLFTDFDYVFRLLFSIPFCLKLCCAEQSSSE